MLYFIGKDLIVRVGKQRGKKINKYYEKYFCYGTISIFPIHALALDFELDDYFRK
jgi:hypothetical protein